MAARILRISALLLALAALTGAARANDYLNDAKRLIAAGDLRAARIQLKNAVRSEPQNMEAHYRLGWVYLQLGEPVAAETEAKTARVGGFDPDLAVVLLARATLAEGKYQQLLANFSPDQGSKARRAEVLVLRGDAQLALNAPADARKSFEAAQQLAPQSAAPLLAEARLLAASQQLKEAGTLFDRALALQPHSADALVGKAQLLRREGNPQGALGLLDKALADNPRLLAVKIERAAAFLDLDKNPQAQSDIAAVLAAQPNNALAIYLRAILNAKEKKFSAADADLDKVSPLLGRMPHAYYVLAVVKYSLHQLNQAEDAARRYATHYPDDPAGQKLLGGIELALGRPADALATLAKLQRSGTADPAALDLIGRAELQMGRPDKAMTAFEAAVKRAPDNAALHYWLGVSGLRAGDAANAVAQLTRSLDLAPSAPAGATLVLTDIEAGRYDAAMKVAETLRQAQPNSPIADNLTGLVKLAQFDLAGARAAFAAVAAKYPGFSPARLNLAQVDELQGRSDAARALLQQILGEHPANAQALTRLVNLDLRTGHDAAAVTAAEQAHAAAADNPGITGGLIDLYLRLGHKNKALALARTEPGSNKPGDVPLIAARARAEVAAGSLADAARTYRRLIAIDKNAIEQRRQLAAVLLSAGDAKGARAAIDAALALFPTNPGLVEDRIAIDLKTDGLAAALAWAKAYATQHPDLPTAAALEGDVLVGASRPDEAVAAYRKAYRQAPSALLAVRLYRMLAATGKPDDGASALRDWLAGHPDDLGIAAQLGAADILGHRYDEARRTLEGVVAKQPKNPVVLNNLAWLYHLTGDPRARSVAERAYALAPGSGEIAATLGWILTKTGHAADAVGLLQQASAAQPASPAFKYHLAVALNDTGQYRAAQKILAALVSGTTNFADKPAAEQLLADVAKR